MQAKSRGFELEGHRRFDTQQLPPALESVNEAAQVLVARGDSLIRMPPACGLRFDAPMIWISGRAELADQAAPTFHLWLECSQSPRPGDRP